MTRAASAADYRGLVVAYRNGAAVRLQDVAEVTDSVESLRNLGIVDGQSAVILLLYKQPGGNITETDRPREGPPATTPGRTSRRRPD